MANKYENLVDKINMQEEIREENNAIGEELRLLKQAVSNLQDCVSKVEQADKDGTDMVTAMRAATESMDLAVFAFCRAVTRAESTVLKVEMTDECKNDIISAREELIKAETALLSCHRSMLLQQMRSQYEELCSFIKSAKGVFLSPKIFWWWAGISYATSLYSNGGFCNYSSNGGSHKPILSESGEKTADTKLQL